MLLLARVNEIQSNGTISVTLKASLVLGNPQGEFTFKDVPPGQYALFNEPLVIGFVNAQGEITTSGGPFRWIEYADAAKLPIESFVFADKDGKEGNGFLFADGKLIVFTIKAGQTLRIEKPIAVKR